MLVVGVVVVAVAVVGCCCCWLLLFLLLLSFWLVVVAVVVAVVVIVVVRNRSLSGLVLVIGKSLVQTTLYKYVLQFACSFVNHLMVHSFLMQIVILHVGVGT